MGTAPRAKHGVLASFQYHDFRYFCLGNFSTFNAGAIWNVAQGWLILSMTNSAFMLGLISFVGNVPFVVFTILGGVMADRMEKRKMLFAAEVINFGCVVVLGVLTSTGWVQVWHVFVISLFSNSAMAFKGSARNWFVMELVDEDHLLNAIALNSMTINSTRIIGSAMGGVLVGLIGVSGTFYVTAVIYTVAMLCITAIKTVGNAGRHTGSVLDQLIEGFRYIRRNEVVFSLLILVSVITLVGLPYQTLLPVFARDVLNVGSVGLGLLSAVSGAGALMGALTLAMLGGYQKRGRMLIGCAAVFIGALIVFALATGFLPSVFALALILMFALGASHVTYLTTTNTLLQTHSPGELRGRVMGVFMLTFGLTPLGALPAGAAATHLGAPTAVGICAVICLLFIALVIAKQPKLWRMA